MRWLITTSLASALLLFSQMSGAESTHLSVLLMESTFLLYGPSAKEPTKSGYGTVFFLGKPNEQKPKSYYLVMVTANHVLRDIKGDEATLMVRRQKTDGRFEPVKHSIKIRSRGRNLYKSHPKADVAAMYMRLPKDSTRRIVPEGFLADDEKVARFEIVPGEQLMCLWFPRAFRSSGGYPILRSGRLASYPLGPASQVGRWLFDFTVFPGNSGWPVFLSGDIRHVGGKAQVGTNLIVGLVTVEHSAIETGEKLMLAGIVPAQFIKETLAMLPNSPAQSRE